ncbi:MAG: hypothetical protein CVU65_11020 [Deltaproteobacteria bacterium HGW-Deltaproteobacteria-22]|jgi:hypothetical protein|nr:MAG: hypothetical protein CVU65_11020 [Deltaproteobacteria bacterium HGW-Deltaproteobacteria-22]
MKIQKNVQMQFGSSIQRTRSPEAFEQAVKKAKGAVGAGLSTLAGVVPSLTVGTPTGSLLASVAGGGGSAASDMSVLQKQQQDANMEYLKLQMEVQAENRQFSTLSNVLKSRHDTAKAAITNLRA